MYAVSLSRAFTGRRLVLKVGGGWHGAQPWGLPGVRFGTESGPGFRGVETKGLPSAVTDEVLVARFNDPESLQDHFRQHGDQTACFIVEPFLGAGGTIPSTREYLHTARRLTRKHGALLILDEIITGFRFHPGSAGGLYGVESDLTTFGKIIGGGMPVSAVAGRSDIMGLVGCDSDHRVRFEGGTFSAHPGSLLAAKTLMQYLVKHEEEVYLRLAELGDIARRTVEAAFADEGIVARCTGGPGEVLPGSSLFMFHFPYEPDARLDRPEDVFDPSVCDVALRDEVSQLALLLEGVCLIHGHGGISTAHNERDIQRLGDACRQVACRLSDHFQR